MAQAVNVLLNVGDKRYDLNTMGLIKLTFDRYLGSTRDKTSNVLSNLDITMFDSTGHSLLSILQQRHGSMKLEYGFTGSLSDVYLLTIIKLNTTYNNLGCTTAVGAIGKQISIKFKPEVYLQGTSIGDIVRKMAKRNGWYIGDDNSTEFINCDIKLPKQVVKSQDYDINFIETILLPIANSAIYDLKNNDLTSNTYWDVQLVNQSGRTEFFFRPYSQRGTTRRVWKYVYSTSTDSSVVSLTNNIDFSFMASGRLAIQVPVTTSDFVLLQGMTKEEKHTYLDNLVKNASSIVSRILTNYGISFISPEDFNLDPTFIAAEDIGNVTLEAVILEALETVMSTVNTITMTVIGNPKIMATDLVDLTIKNKDGSINILSTASPTGSYWKVISISEEIGVDGYFTTVGLTRENITYTSDSITDSNTLPENFPTNIVFPW